MWGRITEPKVFNLPGFSPGKLGKQTSQEYLKLVKAAVDDEENFTVGSKPIEVAPPNHEITEVAPNSGAGAAGAGRDNSKEQADTRPTQPESQKSAAPPRPTRKALRQLQADADRKDVAQRAAGGLVRSLAERLAGDVADGHAEARRRLGLKFNLKWKITYCHSSGNCFIQHGLNK